MHHGHGECTPMEREGYGEGSHFLKLRCNEAELLITQLNAAQFEEGERVVLKSSKG